LETPRQIRLGSWAACISIDPILFIERRMGLGYTLNLGNPWSWVVMIVFVTGIAIPLVLVP
jgi:uncharacterized membrane protein